MFAKLLKYEWKASAGLLGILSGAAVVMGLAGGGALRFIFSLAYAESVDRSVEIIVMPLTLLILFTMLVQVAYVFAIQIILLSRFYKSRFTDEGYLTFTLPVSTAQNYLSALTNILIWDAISGLVMLLSMGLMLFLGLTGVPAFDAPLEMDQITQGYRNLFAVEGFAQYQFLSMVYALVSFFSQPVMVMSCITLGAVLAKKHKVLAAIGLYYGVSVAVNMLSSVGSTAVLIETMENGGSPYSGEALLAVGVQIMIQLAVAVGGSFLSVHLMDKKLNLP